MYVQRKACIHSFYASNVLIFKTARLSICMDVPVKFQRISDVLRRNYSSHIKIQVLSLLCLRAVEPFSNNFKHNTDRYFASAMRELYFIWQLLADGYTHWHWIILSPLWDVTAGRGLQIEGGSSKVCMYLASPNGLKYLWGFSIWSANGMARQIQLCSFL